MRVGGRGRAISLTCDIRRRHSARSEVGFSVPSRAPVHWWCRTWRGSSVKSVAEPSECAQGTVADDVVVLWPIGCGCLVALLSARCTGWTCPSCSQRAAGLFACHEGRTADGQVDSPRTEIVSTASVQTLRVNRSESSTGRLLRQPGSDRLHHLFEQFEVQSKLRWERIRAHQLGVVPDLPLQDEGPSAQVVG